MDGEHSTISDSLVEEFFNYSREVMQQYHMVPFTACITKDNTIITKGRNFNRESNDIRMFSGVATIRWAQESLDSGNLSGYTLVSMFEPMIVDFDIALWAGIRDFVWGINKKSAESYYTNIPYSIREYQKHYPKNITITAGVREEEGLTLLNKAEQLHYFPHL